MEKRHRLCHFYGWSDRHVRSGITSARGWVAYCWALEHEAKIWGGEINRVSKGYVAQEAEKMKRRRKK